MGVGIFPVLEISGRRRQLQSATLEMTSRRPDEAVARVSDPAGAGDQRNIVAAELVLKNEVTLRAVWGKEELDLFRTQAEKQGVVLGKGHSETYRPADSAGPVVTDSQGCRVHVAP